jgi:cytoskeleton protein RodZ
LLRRAREAQRISIEAMAAKIKVSVSKLEALESGRFDQLPDANFTRALAMTLCRALKIDPHPVLAGMPAARPATLFSEVPPLNQPFKASRASMALFDHSSSVDWSAFLKPQWVAPAVLLLAAVVLYAVPGSSEWPGQVQTWWRSHQAASVAPPDQAASAADVVASMPATSQVVDASGVTETLASASNADAASGVPASAPLPALNANGAMALKLDASDAASAAAQSAVPASATAAKAVVPVAPPSPAPTPAAPNSLLSMRAREATWVEVKDAQGNRLLGRLIQRDESVDLSVAPPLTLRVGNAGGLQLSFKGQPVDLVPYTRNNIARLELK